MAYSGDSDGSSFRDSHSGSSAKSPPNFDDMITGCTMFTTQLRRVANAQRELVTRDDLTSILRPMFDEMNQKLDEQKADLNQKLDEHKEDLDRKLEKHKTDLMEHSTRAIAASVTNAQVKVFNVGVTARDQVLMPLCSPRTGDRVDGTAITIDQLAELTGSSAGALLRAIGLPHSGTAAERRSRLSWAMGVTVPL